MLLTPNSRTWRDFKFPRFFFEIEDKKIDQKNITSIWLQLTTVWWVTHTSDDEMVIWKR